MSSIPLTRADVIIGVDTHKQQHVAAAIDGHGGTVGEPVTIDATPDGYAALVAWATGLGTVFSFGVEGCGSYGSGLARYLRRHGFRVEEVARPPRNSDRRPAGKNDAIDPEHAARPVLAGGQTATPKVREGTVEAIRVIKIARDSAVKQRATTMITLKTVLVTAPDVTRAALEKLSDRELIAGCVALNTAAKPDDPQNASSHALHALARRHEMLSVEIDSHTTLLEELTATAAPDLVAVYGVGPDSAAELLACAGENTSRIRSEAAFAKMCGVCPIPAGSGQTNGRHRLFRGGNRQANAALYRIVIVRMRWHPKTIAYVDRRTAEGLSKKDIIRCLKRYVAREIYQALPQDQTIEHRYDPAA